jgi:hypothetical protein
MACDPRHPDVLLSVTNEIEAAAIAAALADYGVKALPLGGYISGFKAEVPGNVAVVVKREDFDRAQEALAEIRRQQGEIDWSKVDVMESADEPAAAEEGSRRWSPLFPVRLCLLLELLGVAICFVIGFFMRELTPELIYAVTAIVLTGIFLALFPFARRR